MLQNNVGCRSVAMETQSTHKPLVSRGAWHRTLTHTGKKTLKCLALNRNSPIIYQIYTKYHASIFGLHKWHAFAMPPRMSLVLRNKRKDLLDSIWYRFELAFVLTPQTFFRTWLATKHISIISKPRSRRAESAIPYFALHILAASRRLSSKEILGTWVEPQHLVEAIPGTKSPNIWQKIAAIRCSLFQMPWTTFVPYLSLSLSPCMNLFISDMSETHIPWWYHIMHL